MPRSSRALIAAIVVLVTTASSAHAAALKPIWHPELRQPVSVTDAPGYAEGGGDSVGASLLAPSVPGGQVVAPLAATTGTVSCTPGWHYVAGKSNSFVTGNCPGGSAMNLSNKVHDPVHNWDWWGGNLTYVNYSGCGWLRTQDAGPKSGSASSGCGEYAYCDYILCDGAGNPYTYGGSTDGLDTTALGGCNEWGNYRPWSSASAPKDSQRLTTGGGWIRVRYLAKYTYGGHRYYMIRDMNVQPDVGDANWVFLRDDCFS